MIKMGHMATAAYYRVKQMVDYGQVPVEILKEMRWIEEERHRMLVFGINRIEALDHYPLSDLKIA